MRKYECVMQDGIKDCGVSSLLTIIKSYGGNAPREYLRCLTNTTQNGVNAFSLLEAGRKLGFDTKAVNGSVLDIDDKFLPCIAHVVIDEKYKHFLVIHRIDKGKNLITLADPGKGIVKVSIDDFMQISTGNFLFFTPNKKVPFIQMENEVKEKLFQFIYQSRKTLYCIMIFSLIYTVVNIILSYNFQFIIEKALSFNSKSNLFFITIVLTILYVFKDIIEYLRNHLIAFIAHKLDYILINNSFSHILLLPHLYYKNRTTGEIISRVNDLCEIRDAVSHLIVTFFVDFILLIFVLVFLFMLSAKLTFIILLFVFFYSISVILFNKVMYYKIKDIKENQSSVNSFMIEMINGIDSIRGINIFETAFNKFSAKYSKYLNSSYSFTKTSNLQKLLGNILISIMTLLTLFVGSNLVLDGNMSIGQLITYNSLIYFFLEPIKNILNFDILFKKINIIVERINEILNIESENLFIDNKCMSMALGSIDIKSLSYSYNGIDYLLKNVSLLIEEGEKVVICGKSGCGKSTLAKIISSYIKVSRDVIYIGNKDINDYNLWSLREGITYVSQNDFLFTDSIYNNININNTRDYNDFSIICNMTLVNEIVKDKTSGYNMLLEENGANISGGERQRIILARTFLKDSNIYILDESFSEIDIERERTILSNLFNAYDKKTIIVISHRFDNNDLYDKVINMENFSYGN